MQPNFDGPIPGENFTSDTRNYPWHRAPDITDYDEAIDYIISQLSEPEPMSVALTLMEGGVSVAGIVSTINMTNISDGKYPIDLSLLIAGPMARYLQLLAKQSGIDADMGIAEDQIMTLEHVKAISGAIEDDPVGDGVPEDATAPVEADTGGLMAMPAGGTDTAPESVQSGMLGYANDEGVMQ